MNREQTDYWTSTNYSHLTEKQARLFKSLHPHLVKLGRPTSCSLDYIAYKKEPEMRGAFVRIISSNRSPFLTIRLALLTENQIHDPRKLCQSDPNNLGYWTRAGLILRYTSQSDTEYILSLIRQAYNYALATDQKKGGFDLRGNASDYSE